MKKRTSLRVREAGIPPARISTERLYFFKNSQIKDELE
jgi:hypothetical protein